MKKNAATEPATKIQDRDILNVKIVTAGPKTSMATGIPTYHGVPVQELASNIVKLVPTAEPRIAPNMTMQYRPRNEDCPTIGIIQDNVADGYTG